ncbi:MAG: DNA repair protein RadC [Spirochaetia bacterium]|jgi:DNA repair protein RadC|nr:DNA repair protein RadC [Spirochaetia bacterium]
MNYSITQATTLKIHELPQELRPRERLENIGAENLSDEELLAILISSGNKSQSVTKISQEVVKLLDQEPLPSMAALMQIKGLGTAKACIIAAALELGRRKTPREQKTVIQEAADVFNVIRHYASRSQEQFIVIGLNGAHEVLEIIVAAVGTVNECQVHPRDVFAPILEKRGVALILAHNHPSGNLLPSIPDRQLTERMIKCGRLLGIKVLDHLVFSTESYYSFAEKDLLSFD